MAAMGELSAMVAHEINNPLSGILSYAKLSSRYLAREYIDSADFGIGQEKSDLHQQRNEKMWQYCQEFTALCPKDLGGL